MKIGILADIHAQYDSLQKALAIFEREQVDMILCAGDLVEKGAYGDKVIKTIIKRNIPCVRGNHDEAAVSNQRWLRKNMDQEHVEETLARLNHGELFVTQLISDRSILFLQTLPFKLEFIWENTKILLVHGSPLSNTQYLMPSMPDSLLSTFLSDVNVDIVICGHSHSPMYRQVGDLLLLNSGSVCQSMHNRESHTCAILNLQGREYQIYSLETGTITFCP